MSKPIVFEGWWSEKEKADCPEPWERFTVMVHGEEAGESREATVDDLLLAGFVPLEMVRDVREQTLSTIQHAPNWTHEQWMVAIDVMDMFEACLRQQLNGDMCQREEGDEDVSD